MDWVIIGVTLFIVARTTYYIIDDYIKELVYIYAMIEARSLKDGDTK